MNQHRFMAKLTRKEKYNITNCFQVYGFYNLFILLLKLIVKTTQNLPPPRLKSKHLANRHFSQATVNEANGPY